MKRFFFGIALCGAGFGVVALPVRAAETAKTTAAVAVQDVRLQQEGPAPAGGRHGTQGAWEEIEPGRFQPRRIRGSFRGRALG